VRPDGPPIDLDDDLVNDGVDAEGIDNWTIGYAGFRPGIDQLDCDVLPPKTSIGFRVPGDRVPPRGTMTASWQDLKTGEVRRFSKDFSADGSCEIRSDDEPDPTSPTV